MSPDVGLDNSGDDRANEAGRLTLNAIQLSLVRMEGNIGAIRTDIGYMRESQLLKSAEYERKFTDQESRIRALEGRRFVETKSMWSLITAFCAVSSIAVAIIAVVTK